jgi:hypothetical protein
MGHAIEDGKPAASVELGDAPANRPERQCLRGDAMDVATM